MPPLPPANQGTTCQPAGSAPANSSPSAGWSWTSPSAPASVAPAYVPACVPAANSEVRLSTSPPAGVVKLAGEAGAEAELPSASAEVTRKK